MLRLARILAGGEYYSDCMARFGRVLNHRLDKQSQMDVRRRFTKPLWKQVYPREPFELPDDQEAVLKQYKNVEKKFSVDHDVIDAAIRLRSFYYQGWSNEIRAKQLYRRY